MIGKRLVAAILFASVLTWQANAAEELSETDKLAIANVHDETMGCLVYYSIVAGLFQNEPSPDRETIETLDQVRQALSEQAQMLGRFIGMKVEASVATMRVVHRSMMQEINDDLVNFSILVEKYGDPCKVVSENPDSRIAFWMNDGTKEP